MSVTDAELRRSTWDPFGPSPPLPLSPPMLTDLRLTWRTRYRSAINRRSSSVYLKHVNSPRELELAHVTGRKRFPRTRLTNHGTAYSLPSTLKTSVHCVSHPRNSIDSVSRSRSPPQLSVPRSSDSSQTLSTTNRRVRVPRNQSGATNDFRRRDCPYGTSARDGKVNALPFLSSSETNGDAFQRRCTHLPTFFLATPWTLRVRSHKRTPPTCTMRSSTDIDVLERFPLFSDQLIYHTVPAEPRRQQASAQVALVKFNLCRTARGTRQRSRGDRSIIGAPHPSASGGPWICLEDTPNDRSDDREQRAPAPKSRPGALIPRPVTLSLSVFR